MYDYVFGSHVGNMHTCVYMTRLSRIVLVLYNCAYTML